MNIFKDKILVLGIYRYDVYKSPNIGLFVKANDRIIMVPFGFAETKTRKLMEFMVIESQVNTSVGGTRLLGPMMVMNNNGILVPSNASDEEIDILSKSSRLKVERLRSRLTAIGNLIATNDNGAILSPLLKGDDGVIERQIQDTLGVPTHYMTIAGFVQTGSMIVATNTGAAVHPRASEDEIKLVSESLQVEVEPITVNGGVPFVSSGMIANSKSVVVGSITSGPELIMISRAFKA